MTAKYVFLNNKIVDQKDALISIFDRSYLYGEGVFETLRAYNGHVAFADLHYERLRKNCQRLNIDMPTNRSEFEKAILKTLNMNKLKDAYIRITVSPVGASFGIERPKKMLTNFSVFCKEFIGRSAELYKEGAKVIVIKNVPIEHPYMANLKSTNYLNKMLARDEVMKSNTDEGIFVSPDGRVLEGTATNLFTVKDSQLRTPPIKAGVLPGITRSVVLNIAEGNSIPAIEEAVSLDHLKEADEVFLTGSTTEILPVREIVDVSVKSPIPGKITEKLMNAYSNLLP